MNAYYEVNKSANGQFYFSLKASNGQIILRSEQYQAKESALKGIVSVQTNCPLSERYEKKSGKKWAALF